jgi:hypothetical protein
MFKYYLRKNFKPLENSEMVPKFQVATACFSRSRPQLNASGLYVSLALEAPKLYSSQLTRESKFRDPCLQKFIKLNIPIIE